jgi:hypothetical protein
MSTDEAITEPFLALLGWPLRRCVACGHELAGERSIGEARRLVATAGDARCAPGERAIRCDPCWRALVEEVTAAWQRVIRATYGAALPLTRCVRCEGALAAPCQLADLLRRGDLATYCQPCLDEERADWDARAQARLADLAALRQELAGAAGDPGRLAVPVEAAVRRFAAHAGALARLVFDPREMIDAATWWFVPLGAGVGTYGHLIDKPTLAVTALGSAWPLADHLRAAAGARDGSA